MNVLSKVRGFLSRHKNKFVVGGIVITGSILLTKYAQQKLKDWQDKETREFLERTRKQQHFESTERTCNQTILSLLATLNEALGKVVDTESVVAQLRSNPENKVELWNELKVLVLTKASCLIYLAVMMVVTLRIQLNIVGGYLFKDANSVTTEMQQKYLLLCNNVLGGGVKKIATLIKNEYSKILQPFDLKQQVKLGDFDNVFWAIQSTMCSSKENPIHHLTEYIIPEGVPTSKDVYSNMVGDTADLLESDEVKSLTSHCINRGFVVLTDELSEYYSGGSGDKIKEVSAETASTNGFIHPSDVQIPLAKLIPIINGLVSQGTLPDKVIQQLIMNDRLKTFGANVYECFSNAK